MTAHETSSRSVPRGVVLAFGDSRDQALSVLHHRTLRATRPRVEVLAALFRTPPPGHRTVPELHAAITGVDLVTVYRIVGTLTAKNVLHRLDIPDRPASYGLADRPHHHAVCHCCAGVTEIPAGDLQRHLDEVSHRAMFSLAETGSLTLHGLCHDCQGPHGTHPSTH